MDVDVVIIGAGFGGYTAALRLGNLGKNVVMVDRDRAGGVCLLRGCIPSKAMIHAAELLHSSKNSQNIGITADTTIDINKVYEWKNSIVDNYVAGIESQCKRAGVNLIHGEASIVSKNSVKVDIDGKEEPLEIITDNIIIATGSSPIQIPGFEFDGKFILSSSDILSLKDIPETMCIIGGGAIGLEMGTFFTKLGSKVTIVEVEKRILTFIDKDAARIISKGLDELGIDIRTGTSAKACQIANSQINVNLENDAGNTNETFDMVLVAVGRHPNSSGSGLENLNMETDEKGFIKIDSNMMTTVPGIYAIGDVAGQPMLAHKAAQEGLIAADAIAQKKSKYSRLVPLAMFTDPEISMVGLTEENARAKGLKVTCKRLYFAAIGRAMTMNDTRGFVKLIVEDESRKILGIQIVGYDASNLISEGVLAVEMGMTVDELASIIHPHPTLSEALGECARLF